VVVCHAAVAFTYDMCWLCEEAVSIFEDAEGMLGGLFILSCHHFVAHFLVGICQLPESSWCVVGRRSWHLFVQGIESVVDKLCYLCF
jgi:hypothetical protein